MKTAYEVKFRGRREGKVDFNKRLAFLKSEKNRLVVRRKNRQIIAQIVAYEPQGDKNLVNTTSLELKKYGYAGHLGNACAAYLTGFLCGRKAVKKKIIEAVLDVGRHTPVHGSNIFAALRGAVDAGMQIPHSESVLPENDRAYGKKIEAFRKISLNVDNVKKEIEAKI